MLKGIFILFYFSRILNSVYKMCVEPSLQPLRLSPAEDFIFVKREQEGTRTFGLDSVFFFP